MSKNTYYFSHDLNAMSDEKILDLRLELGWEGYGLYWAIIEKLGNASGYKLQTNYKRIAFEMQTQCDRIESVVTDFGLFIIEDGLFWSKSLCKRLGHLDQKREQAKRAAEARWKKASEQGEGEQPQSVRNADALQPQSVRNAKKSKVNKEKENKEEDISILASYSFSPSILEAIEEYSQHLKSLGKDFKKSDIAWKKFYNTVEKFIGEYGEDITIGCIDSAIEGNWKTLYPPKKNNQNQGSPKSTSLRAGTRRPIQTEHGELWVTVLDLEAYKSVLVDDLAYEPTMRRYYYATTEGSICYAEYPAGNYSNVKLCYDNVKKIKVGEL